MQKKNTILKGIPLLEVDGVYTARGCEAQFYRMGTSRYGLKLYRSFHTAYESFMRQKKAAEKGLAPQVKRFVVAKKKNRKSVFFGYETEKARDLDDWNDKEWTIYNRQSDKLFDKLRKIGLGGDFGDTNCGIIKGKLVAVDFGSHSTCEW
jgi:hypothetical protein